MLKLRSAPVPARSLCALILGLLLALRLLSPAGFMPAFDHGAVTIVHCPDAGDTPISAMKMHHKRKANHEGQCPYASASSLGALGADFTALLNILVPVAALLLGSSFAFIERRSGQLRPPQRGPPLPA